jgi:hypothetical protein
MTVNNQRRMHRSSSLVLCLVAFASACGARSSDTNDSKIDSTANDGGAESGNWRSDAGANGSGGPNGNDHAVGVDPSGTSNSPGVAAPGTGVTAPPSVNIPPTGVTAPGVTSPPATATVTPVPTTPPTGGMEPAPIGEGETCPSGTDYPYLDNTETGFSGVIGFAAWGDGVTSMCLRQEPGRVCAYGVAVPGGADYSNWGAGFSLTLTPNMDEGRDLRDLGIFGVRVGFSQIAGRNVRLMATRANDPNLDFPSNYSNNAFYLGGSSPREFITDTQLIAGLGDFTLPSWTMIMADGAPATGQMLDPRQVSTLQVTVVNNPNDEVVNYSYCVDDLAFIDAAGAEVPLPTYEAPDAGVDQPDQTDLPDQADQTPQPDLPEPPDAGPPAVSDAGATVIVDDAG